MFDSVDAASPFHHLRDAGFVPEHCTKPSRAGNRSPSKEKPPKPDAAKIEMFNNRRTTYDRRSLPKLLDCAPRGGRLLCMLEDKFADRGFAWWPIIRSANGLVFPFGHNSDGYAVLTENNAKIIADRAPAGTPVTVELQEDNAFLYEISIKPDGTVNKVRLLYTFKSVASIGIECRNKPTFNGEDVSFEDLYHQKITIFDPPKITSAV